MANGYLIPTRDKYSEDMDFSLLEKNDSFTLNPYFDAIIKEFAGIGRKVEITKKKKKTGSNIESAFLKDNTEVYNLAFKTERTVKIRIEVDKDPPLKFNTEHRLLLLPFSFMTRCFTIPGLYAGKMHALLFKNWKGRVKGRDWYDFEWFVRNGYALDFGHLKERAIQTRNVVDKEFTKDHFLALLKSKIEQTNINLVIADVFPFVQDPEALTIWSIGYFTQLADMIKF